MDLHVFHSSFSRQQRICRSLLLLCRPHTAGLCWRLRRHPLQQSSSQWWWTLQSSHRYMKTTTNIEHLLYCQHDTLYYEEQRKSSELILQAWMMPKKTSQIIIIIKICLFSADFNRVIDLTYTNSPLSSLQGSLLFLWMADIWSQDCWLQGRVTEWRPSCLCRTAASRGCRAHLQVSTEAQLVVTVAAEAQCPSAWSCPWRKETAWAWWGPEASWPPLKPGRFSPPTAPSSCTHSRPKDSWSSARTGLFPDNWTEGNDEEAEVLTDLLLCSITVWTSSVLNFLSVMTLQFENNLPHVPEYK